jgi:two-component system phosphate regulon response regulator PhoB
MPGDGSDTLAGVQAANKTILVVEDEADLADLIAYNLQRAGYVCRCASDGETALADARRQTPSLIILDRMLPKKSGDDVIAQLRRDPRTAEIPVLMLTAKVGESDQLTGFSLGADDYVTKPFSMKVLLARVAAILRRADVPDETHKVVTIGPISIDHSRHEVTVDGTPVQLTMTEFRLLSTLAAAHERVLDRQRLIDAALGQGVAVTDRTIDVHIAYLRKKLGRAASWIQTVRGVGYTFRPPQ